MSESGNAQPGMAPESLCFVKEVKNRCRICYTCVRECPAKAISISKSQAIIVPERCIGCGNCLKVCSQQAKRMVSSIEEAEVLLKSGASVAACLAPSFPVEFQAEFDFRVLVGMTRALGFDHVTEVAFGADLVADRYREALILNQGRQYIATTCPAIVGFVERYHPDLVSYLSPIVSPMVAMARVLRSLHGPDLKIIFVGPCVAKKAEAQDPDVHGGPDVVLTFTELRELFERAGVTPATAEPCDFDPPQPRKGSLFPISKGLLEAAEIREDLLINDVVATDGLHNFMNALNEFAGGGMEANLVELLSCNGCIAGPGLSSKENLFQRRARVSHYTRYRERHPGRGALAEVHRSFRQPGPDPLLPLAGSADHRHRRAGDRPDHEADGQARQRGRTQLRRLRLSILPRACGRHPQGAGRERDVPALRHQRPLEDHPAAVRGERPPGHAPRRP